MLESHCIQIQHPLSEQGKIFSDLKPVLTCIIIDPAADMLPNLTHKLSISPFIKQVNSDTAPKAVCIFLAMDTGVSFDHIFT